MDQLPALLDEGRVDVGFIRLPMDLAQSLGVHVVSRDRFCIALPSEHVLVASGLPVQPSALAHEAFIVPEQS